MPRRPVPHIPSVHPRTRAAIVSFSVKKVTSIFSIRELVFKERNKHFSHKGKRGKTLRIGLFGNPHPDIVPLVKVHESLDVIGIFMDPGAR